jgi:Rhodopirellula transposase DDE domain
VIQASENALAAKFTELLPHLDERQRRLALGAEARMLGHGGIRLVARAARVDEDTVSRGTSELGGGQAPLERVRRPGAGRRSAAEADPGLVEALLNLVEPGQRGDPESPLRWTTKSLRNLASALAGQGHKVGADTVGRLLKQEGFTLQGTSRTTEGARHPDRDAQFGYINARVESFLAAGLPVVSMDAKKKEVLGDYAVIGREWHRAGDGPRVRAHDFPEKDAVKAVPYGVYDLAADSGWVSVGCDGDTAAFAVATLARWWQAEGRRRYPAAARLLITADAGGSNGYRVRAWKAQLAAFALDSGLEVTVCHFPPGTSKWNRIEHRLFSHISVNWRGRPLTSHEVVVALIGATTTATGLRVHAELDAGSYPTGVQVSDQVLASLPLTAHDWHGQWNYTLAPEPPAPLPPPRLTDRAQAEDRAPAWLRHPALIHLNSMQFENLRSEVEQYLLDHPPISLTSRPARRSVLRRGPLSLTDRLLITLLHQRWGTQLKALAPLLNAPRGSAEDAVHEITPILAALGHPSTKAPITAPTAADLARLVGHQLDQEPK